MTGLLDFGEPLFEQYRSHDVYVLPSLSEGTPRTLVEARGFGCPVVATRAGGIPSSVDDGRTGLLVEPRDAAGLAAAIERVLDDPALRHHLIEEGLRKSPARSLESFADELLEEVAILHEDFCSSTAAKRAPLKRLSHHVRNCSHLSTSRRRRCRQRVAGHDRHRGAPWTGRLGHAQYLQLEKDAAWRVALGHRRLSIIDLSEAGRQPMVYRDRFWITYNGEVYNYLELRRELEQLGHAFRSHCDTEVILAAYAQWGVDCFERFRGMWGLVLVDLERRCAVLSRDRMGIKPLYILRRGGLFAVASEIKQYIDLPHGRLSPEPAAVRRYLATGYEDAATTFFAEVLPVPAGHSQRLNLDTLELGLPQPYWFPERVEQTITRPEEAAERFRQTLRDSVRLHMRSDVPVGCATVRGTRFQCRGRLRHGDGKRRRPQGYSEHV